LVLIELLRITLIVGLSGIEPLTSRLSGVRSNHLSYRPSYKTIMKRTDEPELIKKKERVNDKKQIL
jgi:hypothetical protein